MEFKAHAMVRGFTKYKGNIDGQDIDSNTVFVDVSIGKMGKGTRTAARKCESEDVIKRIEHLPLPFEAEITLEEEATAKRETMLITDIKPLRAQPPQQKAA